MVNNITQNLRESALTAARVVAEAAEVAAVRIADAAKSASDSAASAASAQAAAAQVLGAVAVARLDSMDKKFDSHEDLDRDRFNAIAEAQKETKEELKEEIKEIATDLKKQTRTITLITGGIIALSKVPDVLKFLHGG